MTKAEGLAKGREVWTARSEFRRAVEGAGSVQDAKELLATQLEEGVPEWLKTMPLLVFLGMVPRIKNDRATKIVERTGIRDWSLLKLGQLDKSQRDALAASLRV